MAPDVSFVRDVARFFGVANAVPVGSGTSGLYLALRAVGVARRRVIVPAFTCPSVAIAVLAAGGKPLLTDVSREDCNLSVEAVADVLDETVAAIVSVDSFGYGAHNVELRELASRYDCALVEDACQAYGGVTGGVPLGGQGDIGVISFSTHKAVELGSGGFILTDDRTLAMRVERSLRAPDFAALEWLRSRVFRRASLDFERMDRLRLLCVHGGLLRYRFPERRAGSAPAAWASFVAELPETREILQLIRLEMETWPLITPFRYEGDEWLPWHASFTVADEDVADRLVGLAVESGVPLARNYPATSDYFPDLDRADSLANAQWIAAHIYNLPTRVSLDRARAMVPRLHALRRAVESLVGD